MQPDRIKFEGEEAGAGYASPTLDLIAAGFLLLLAVVVMVASLRLPVPGGVLTAPGLLPFLTAASLLLMALVLAITAIRRRRNGETGSHGEERSSHEDFKALSLAVVIAIYIAALQFLAFQHTVAIGGGYFTISAFEPVTVVALAAIIHACWRGPLWITTTVCIVWTLVLSTVFQKAFLIPLPGGF